MKARWVKYAPYLRVEYLQCFDEGLDVEPFKGSLATSDENEAAEIGERLITAPVRAGYPFAEPSDYEGILAARPPSRPIDREVKGDIHDRLAGAWIGRIAGCLLGKPVEGFSSKALQIMLEKTNNYPLRRYMAYGEMSEALRAEVLAAGGNTEAALNGWIDNIDGCCPSDDDINYTVIGLLLLEKYGIEFSPNDVLDIWLYRLPYYSTCTAERVAYRNAACGVSAPLSAQLKNPYREWIGAQIRGDIFGYVCAGRPDVAAALAYKDACVSHIKNGVYGEMFAAALIAAAASLTDMPSIIRAALNEIPARCRLSAEIQYVLEGYEKGKSFDDIMDYIYQKYDEKIDHHAIHTVPNAMIVVAALLFGGGDFGRTICLAVQPGYDTDCNGATAGSVIGILLGKSNIDTYWYMSFGEKVQPDVIGCGILSVDELAQRTATLYKKYYHTKREDVT